jgi:tetratricopeptide (TPR) repeat protein
MGMFGLAVYTAAFGIMFGSGALAQNSRENKVCERASSNSITVVVGRMTVVTNSPNEKNEMFARMGANTLAASMYQARGLDVSVWNPDGPNSRGFPAAALLISSIFLSAPVESPKASDTRSEANQAQIRRSAETAQILKDMDCDFLLGANVSIDSSFITIYPFVLGAQEATIRRPFDPIVFKLGVRLTTIADQLADAFHKYIVDQTKEIQSLLPITSVRFDCPPKRMNSDITEKRYYASVATILRYQLKALNLHNIDFAALPIGACEASNDSASNGVIIKPILLSKDGGTEYAAVVSFPVELGAEDRPVASEYSQGSIIVRSGVQVNSVEDTSQVLAGRISELIRSVYRSSGGFPRVTQTVLSNASSNPEPFLMIGQADTKLEEAILSLRISASTGEKSSLRDIVLAKLLLLKGMHESASDLIETLTPLVGQLPNFQRAKFFEVNAQILKENGLLDNSFSNLELARKYYTELSDTAAIVRIELAVSDLLNQQGKGDKALRHLLDAAQHTQDAKIYQRIGELYHGNGDTLSALSWLQLAAKLDQNNSEVRTIIGQLSSLQGEAAYDQGRYQDAYNFFQAAKDYYPTAKHMYQAGLAAGRIGRNPEAIGLFRQVVSQQGGLDAVRWVEASSLLLLQTLLVQEEYKSLKQSASEMRRADFSVFTEANVVSLYLLSVAYIVQSSEADQPYEKSTQFEQLEQARKSSTSQTIRWDDAVINSWLAKKELTGRQLFAIALARQVAGLSPEQALKP